MRRRWRAAAARGRRVAVDAEPREVHARDALEVRRPCRRARRPARRRRRGGPPARGCERRSVSNSACTWIPRALTRPVWKRPGAARPARSSRARARAVDGQRPVRASSSGSSPRWSASVLAAAARWPRALVRRPTPRSRSRKRTPATSPPSMSWASLSGKRCGPSSLRDGVRRRGGPEPVADDDARGPCRSSCRIEKNAVVRPRSDASSTCSGDVPRARLGGRSS